ncbi:MAG: hypothetical protein GF353_03375 [Candidatus Lokiarchaeota archaeon]|nr:hypothetical protein [Candidatus Lokiarchaeota archaeon]
MEDWPVELPLIFIEYVRNDLIPTYEDSSVRSEVSDFLDEILEDVAVPRLINVLDGDNEEEILMALTRIEELSKKDAELTKPIKPYLSNLLKSKNRQITNIAQKISDNFAKAERKKELAKKRKIMREKEQMFLEGKLDPEDYAQARKDYLTLRG